MRVGTVSVYTMERNRTEDPSVGGAVVAVVLLGAVSVAVAHPVGAGFVLLGAGAMTLSTRALWRQATGRGLSLPGIGGRLRVETGTVRSERQQWIITVSIVEA